MKKFWIIAVNGVAHVFGERFTSYAEAQAEAEKRAIKSPKNTFLVLGLRAYTIADHGEVITVDYGEEGGTLDYDELYNKPAIDGIILTKESTAHGLGLVRLEEYRALLLLLADLEERVSALEGKTDEPEVIDDTDGHLVVKNLNLISDEDGHLVVSDVSVIDNDGHLIINKSHDITPSDIEIEDYNNGNLLASDANVIYNQTTQHVTVTN